MLGGKDNFEADRLAAAEAIEIFPKTVQSAQSCRTYLSRIPPGSYLAIGHHTADIYPELREFARRLSELNPEFTATLRDKQQVTDLFAGLDLVAPGVVQISRWRPESEADALAAAALWGGSLGSRKPATKCPHLVPVGLTGSVRYGT